MADNDSQSLKKYLSSPLLWLAAYFLLNLAAPFLSIPNFATWVVAGLVIIPAYVCIVTCFAVSVGSKKLELPKILMWTVFAGIVWAVFSFGIGPAILRPIFHEARQHPKMSPALGTQLLVISLQTITSVALMGLSVCAGNVGARLIRTPNMMGPICVVIALVDIWGVLFGGIVSQMLSKAPQVAAKGMTAGPKVGAATGSHFGLSVPDVGAGDYLFLGLLFGALFLLGLNWRGAWKWVTVLVAFALLSIVFLPFIPALPGLLFIALGVAIPNYKEILQFTREEKFALIYAGIFVVILTGALYWGFKQALPDKGPAPRMIPKERVTH